jgi:hypothetical protein
MMVALVLHALGFRDVNQLDFPYQPDYFCASRPPRKDYRDADH